MSERGQQDPSQAVLHPNKQRPWSVSENLNKNTKCAWKVAKDVQVTFLPDPFVDGGTTSDACHQEQKIWKVSTPHGTEL